MRFQVFKKVAIWIVKMAVFRDVAQCGLVETELTASIIRAWVKQRSVLYMVTKNSIFKVEFDNHYRTERRYNPEDYNLS
jgi:hypothetical protein